MTKNLLYLTIFLYFLSAGAYILSLFMDVSPETLGVAYLLLPIIAFITGFLLTKEFSLKSKKGRNIALITFGIFLWLLGELSWTYQDLILEVYPFPSQADIFYLLAYPVFFLGLFNEVGLVSINWFDKKHRAVFFLTLITVIVTGGLIFYTGVFGNLSSDVEIFEKLISTSYGVGDLVLLAISVMILRIAIEFRKGKLFLPWITMFIGFLATLIADILFVYLAEAYELGEGIVYVGLDVLWITSYFFFAISFLKMIEIINYQNLDMLKWFKGKK